MTHRQVAVGKAAVVLLVIAVLGALVFFLVPNPDIRLPPTGFCGAYPPPSLECGHTTYLSSSMPATGVGASYIGGHYFLHLGQSITLSRSSEGCGLSPSPKRRRLESRLRSRARGVAAEEVPDVCSAFRQRLSISRSEAEATARCRPRPRERTGLCSFRAVPSAGCAATRSLRGGRCPGARSCRP